MSKNSDSFVNQWVSVNVHNMPGLEDYTPHVAKLAEQLIVDAENEGIKEEELNETIDGDAEEYLKNAYEKVQDSTLGFHESKDAA